jgi:histidine triad (HIT) family protein
MSHDPSCIFCRIVAGQIPCHRLWEDEATLAFLDINPANPGHALAICKDHHGNLFETPPATLARVMATAQRVALAVQAELRPDGLNILQANGPGAAQSVPHLHLHVLPRRLDDGLAMNWGLKPGDPAALAALATRLRARIG